MSESPSDATSQAAESGSPSGLVHGPDLVGKPHWTPTAREELRQHQQDLADAPRLREENELLRGHLQNMVDLASYSFDVLSGQDADNAEEEINAAKEFLQGPISLTKFLTSIARPTPGGGTSVPINIATGLLELTELQRESEATPSEWYARLGVVRPR